MKRRIIAALMCLCMLVGLLPMSAFAAPAEPGPLKPSDKYYTFNGESAATAESADITLSKTAVDKGDGTYDVTLTAQADQVVMAKATEVVFVIDGSGSMRHCILPENKCNHNRVKGNWCTVTEDNHDASRWNIALDAIGTMKDKLGEEGVSYKYVVYAGWENIWTYEEEQWEELLGQEPPLNALTFLSKGVEKALTCFDKGLDTNKVMIIVADGASTDGYPQKTEKDWRGEEKPTDFGKFEQNGGKVYTVGFTFNDPGGDFHTMSSGDGYHFTATNKESLNISMDKISENIKGLITDPMGDGVELVDGTLKIQGSNYQPWVAGNTINWTDPDGLKDTVTLTYTVRVKDGAVTVGHNTIHLNGKATLNYKTGTNSTYREVAFPVPTAQFNAATLQVEYYYNNQKLATDPATPEWVNVDRAGAVFTTEIPAKDAEYKHGNETYYVDTVTGAPGDTLTATAYTVRVDLTKEKPPVYAPASVTKTPVIAESVTLTAPGAEKTTTLTQGTDYIKVEQKDGAYVATAGVDENSATVLFAVTVTATDAGLVDVTDADATYKGMSGTAAAASVGQDGKVTLTFTEAGTVILYFSKPATFETSNPATVTNEVSLVDGEDGDENDRDSTTVTVTKIEPAPSLAVTKTSTIKRGDTTVTGNAKPGDVVTYTITVTNNGNVELYNVTVKDTFTGAVAPDENWTTTNGKFEKTWTINSLAVDDSRNTATYTYTVQAADQGKTITNSAVAKSGTTEGGDTTTVTVYDPDMTVTKAVTKVNDTVVAAGETVVVQKDDVLTYTITVQNIGDQDLTNVVVTDTKWSNGTKITVSGVNDPVTLTDNSYTISSLTEKAIVTITYTYTVTEADVKAEKVTNNVSVKSNETPDGESGGTTTKVVGNYTIIASSGANGTISPEGSVTVTAGADKTFTITADAGYHISNVTVDSVSKGAVSSYTFEDVQANHTIHATFAKNSTPTSYTLYYHPNFGGYKPFYQSSSTRSVTVKEYENVGRLPERDGYVFVSWNTEPDGSGERYMPGDTFRIDGSSDNLYAQWQKDKTGPDDSGVSNWLETDEHRAYLTGYPDSTFRADRNMTRAEVAQMFYALLLDKNVTITKSFSDVPDDAWYATAVKTLASLGMMDGYPDGTFRPDEPITRAEFATVGLAFAYDPFDADCSYYDVSASAWYHTYVAQATTYGWIGGYPDNTFRPGNNITRVEVCVIVNNMLGRDADERYIDRHEDELVHFVDLSDSYWGYYTIMESTNTHEYTGSFTNEKWTDVK